MQWIGAQGHHLGSDKDEQQVSGTVRAAAGHAAISANMSAEGIRGTANWIARKKQGNGQDQNNNNQGLNKASKKNSRGNNWD